METGKKLQLGILGTGRMGTMVEKVCQERGHTVLFKIGSKENRQGAALTKESLGPVDVLIDFSLPTATPDNIRAACEAGCSLVVGTTGWADGSKMETVRNRVEEAGVGFLYSPNFAIGMHRFLRLMETAARLAAGDRELDVWIEEAHHRGKADHPSGTALALAERILPLLPAKQELCTRLPDGPVGPEQLFVGASRGGSVPGEHRVIIDGVHESIQLVHTARTREVFASGAVRAAEWLHGKSGFYTLEDLIDEGLRENEQ